MRLSACYNVFDDSVELLLASIQQLRPVVDKIVIITQNVSNFNQPVLPTLFPYLSHLKQVGLIDLIYSYQPTNFGNQYCHYNEFNKRLIGRNIAYQLGCSHFISIDSDEMYKTNEVELIKEIIRNNKYTSTACHIQDYHKKPEYQIKDLANYFVPFIHHIFSEPRLDTDYFVYCDPTRKVVSNTNWLIPSDKLVMHHMTTVRNDLKRKYENSSANINFNNIDEMVRNIQNFDPNKNSEPKVNIVDDAFNINQSINYYNNFVEIYNANIKN